MLIIGIFVLCLTDSSYYLYILIEQLEPPKMKLKPQAFKNKHIVIVDDDLPSVKYYATLLNDAGAKVNIFSNGKEFADFLETGNVQVDLVIMDYLLPYINGIDCLRLLRRKSRSIPLIMVTAYCSDQIRNESFIAGCNDFILKPIFPAEFISLIKKYLTSKDYARVN